MLLQRCLLYDKSSVMEEAFPPQGLVLGLMHKDLLCNPKKVPIARRLSYRIFSAKQCP